MSDPITMTQDDGIAKLILNRPAVFNAFDHDMVEQIEEVNVGAVILAPGYQVYNAELSSEYGLGRYPNVVTALQLERLLSASGPTGGHVQRPSDGEPAKKIAFLNALAHATRSMTTVLLCAVCTPPKRRS